MVRMKKLVSMILAVTLILSASEIAYAGTSAVTKQARQVTKYVNKERQKRGRSKLKLDKKLCKAANKRAKELSRSFSHLRPDGSDCFTLLDEYNIKYHACGENIAAGQTSSKMVVDSWMGSTGHRKNILSKSYKKIGVGYYKKSGSEYRYHWVQIFTD